MGVGLPPRIEEAKAGSLGYFAQAVGNDLFDIPVGLLTRDKRLDPHALGQGWLSCAPGHAATRSSRHPPGLSVPRLPLPRAGRADAGDPDPYGLARACTRCWCRGRGD